MIGCKKKPQLHYVGGLVTLQNKIVGKRKKKYGVQTNKKNVKTVFFLKPSTSDRNYLVIGGFVSVVLIT